MVTGVSPQSIGQMTAMAFASQAPSQLILASRTPSKLAAVAAEIAAAYPSVPVTTVVVDLSSQQSVRAAAATIAGLTDRVDVLVNNAGATVRRRVWSAERIELQLAANHVGPFLLTNLLLPLLERAASQKGAAAGATRIVNVSSHGHRLSPLRFHDYNFEGRDIPPEEDHFKPLPPAFARTTQDGYPGVVAYGQSKTANILFTVYLQKHLRARGIGSYSLHPGGKLSRVAGRRLCVWGVCIYLTDHFGRRGDGARTGPRRRAGRGHREDVQVLEDAGRGSVHHHGRGPGPGTERFVSLVRRLWCLCVANGWTNRTRGIVHGQLPLRARGGPRHE